MMHEGVSYPTSRMVLYGSKNEPDGIPFWEVISGRMISYHDEEVSMLGRFHLTAYIFPLTLRTEVVALIQTTLEILMKRFLASALLSLSLVACSGPEVDVDGPDFGPVSTPAPKLWDSEVERAQYNHCVKQPRESVEGLEKNVNIFCDCYVKKLALTFSQVEVETGHAPIAEFNKVYVPVCVKEANED